MGNAVIRGISDGASALPCVASIITEKGYKMVASYIDLLKSLPKSKRDIKARAEAKRLSVLHAPVARYRDARTSDLEALARETSNEIKKLTRKWDGVMTELRRRENGSK